MAQLQKPKEQPKKEADAPQGSGGSVLPAEIVDSLYKDLHITREEWVAGRRMAAAEEELPLKDVVGKVVKNFQRDAMELGKVSSTGSPYQVSKKALTAVFSPINTVAELTGMSVSQLLIKNGVDPKAADGLGVAAELATDFLFPVGGTIKAGLGIARYSIRAAKIATPERILKLIQKIEKGESAGKAVSRTEDVAKVAEKSGKPAEEVIEKLENTSDRIMDTLINKSAEMKEKIGQITKRVSREEIAERARKGEQIESMVSPEKVAMKVQHLTPLMAELNADHAKLVADGVPDNGFLEFLVKTYHAMDEVVAYRGLRASAGRSLGEFRDPTTAMTGKLNDFMDWASHLFSNPMNSENLLSWKNVIMDELGALLADSDKAATLFLQNAAGGGAKEMLRSYMYANIFSGPMTMVKNTIGGLSMIAAKGASHPIAAMYQRRLGLPAHPIEDTQAMWAGYIQGAAKGFEAFKHGNYIDSGQKAETLTSGPGWLSYGTKLLQGTDSIVQGAVINGELTYRGLLAGRQAGKTGDELAQFVVDFIASPPPKVASDVMSISREAAARSDPGFVTRLAILGRDKLDNWLPVAPVGTMLMPVIRAVASLGRSVYNHSPALSVLSKRTYDDLTSGDPIKAADTLRRITMVHLLSPLAFGLAASGHLTGEGPSDPQLQADWKETGWAPRRLIVGGKSIPLDGFSPFGDVLAWHATLYEMHQTGELKADDAENLMKSMAHATMSLFEKINFMDTAGEVLSNVTNPNAAIWEKLGAQALTMVTPYSGLVRSYNQITDPTVREPLEEVNSLFATTAKRLGIGGKAKRDIFGNKIYAPVLAGEPTGDSPEAQLIRNVRPRLRSPGREVFGHHMPESFAAHIREEDIPFVLNDDEWDERQMNAGAFFNSNLQDLMKQRDFMNLPDPQKRTVIEGLWQHSNKYAIAQLFDSRPDTVKRVEQYMQTKAEIMAGTIDPQQLERIRSERRILAEPEQQPLGIEVDATIER